MMFPFRFVYSTVTDILRFVCKYQLFHPTVLFQRAHSKNASLSEMSRFHVLMPFVARSVTSVIILLVLFQIVCCDQIHDDVSNHFTAMIQTKTVIN